MWIIRRTLLVIVSVLIVVVAIAGAAPIAAVFMAKLSFVEASKDTIAVLLLVAAAVVSIGFRLAQIIVRIALYDKPAP